MFGFYGLPILSTVPRSGTWFLRYAISFLCHLEGGGRIDDRITGRVIGMRSGAPFDFQRFKGGPLFRVKGTLPAEHLFIGHTTCPGFDGPAAGFGWWPKTSFHVPGYDYLHDGMNYRYTPVDLAPYDYTSLRVRALERSASKGRGQPAVLVYRHPLEQAASYYRYSQNHKDPKYNSCSGRPLTGVPFRNYLLKNALPSYAKQFVSFQEMAKRQPGQVMLVPYEHLMEKPVETLAGILDHLSGRPQQWLALDDAVWLARREHMKAIERELGRSLDGTRLNRGSHITQGGPGSSGSYLDAKTRNSAIALLEKLGVSTALFDWTVDSEEVSAA